MGLHLIKLAVGVEDVDHLARLQTARIKRAANGARGAAADGRLVHVTRQMPKRADEILGGGSIYWVIRGVIQARQRLLGIEKTMTDEGKKACELVLDPALVLTEPTVRRAFQGWRYFDEAKAPKDRAGPLTMADGAAPLPDAMARDLRDLGLI